MKAYLYRAALYCQWCGEKLCRETPKPQGMNPDDESTWDSGDYPKGPYSNGGGEADTPQHCDACGEFLENTLTSDGGDYVREKALPYMIDPDGSKGNESWVEVADRAEQDRKVVLADWIRYYFAPGM